MASCWGFLPVAVPCTAFIVARLGALAFPGGRASEQVLAGSVLSAASIVAGVHVFGGLHLLTGPVLLGAWLAVAAVLLGTPTSGRSRLLRSAVALASAPLPVIALFAIAVVTVTAYWLPVWQWDALGYHLPYVNFALAAHGFDGVPEDVPYVSSYPHNVEDLILALRAMLPDDRLVDLAQIPCGLVGAVATAAIARLYGASSRAAGTAGAAWLLVPAVWLQLPTDYVDVACAAFLLAAAYFVLSVWSAPLSASSPSRTRTSLLFAGIALGLFLGSKPNAPLSASILVGVLAAAGARASQLRVTALSLVLVVALGGGAFIANAIHHGNPVWPVRLDFGPIHLPGKNTMRYLLESGAAAPRLHGSLGWRVLKSWTAVRPPPVFDMRIGGLGPLFLFAFPFSVMTAVRGRFALSALTLAAAVATPDPAVARYALAVPGLVFAMAAPRLDRLGSPARQWLNAAVAAGAVFQIVQAWPGLTGEGPPLLAYAHMTEPERKAAVGANGRPTAFIEARKRVKPNETFAFDQSLDLPYLAWESDLRYRAVWISDTLTSDAVEGFLNRENVRVVAASAQSPMGEWLRQRPEQYEKLFPCRSTPCSVYARR
jgi:hypothetical protein